MVALRDCRVMSPISPIVVCGPRLRTRTERPSSNLTMMPTRPSTMKCMQSAGSPCEAMMSFWRTSSRRQQAVSCSARSALPRRLREPFAQASSLRILRRMGGNDLFFAGLQGVIEIVRQDDVGSNDFAVAERGDEFRRQIHEHEAGADIVGGTLDLSKAMHGGGIDTGNQAIIKYEEAGIGPLRKQLFDLLVEAIGRAEKR